MTRLSSERLAEIRERVDLASRIEFNPMLEFKYRVLFQCDVNRLLTELDARAEEIEELEQTILEIKAENGLF